MLCFSATGTERLVRIKGSINAVKYRDPFKKPPPVYTRPEAGVVAQKWLYMHILCETPSHFNWLHKDQYYHSAVEIMCLSGSPGGSACLKAVLNHCNVLAHVHAGNVFACNPWLFSLSLAINQQQECFVFSTRTIWQCKYMRVRTCCFVECYFLSC